MPKNLIKTQIQATWNNFWLIWFLVLSIIFLIHSLTLSISPTIWQDEVQIIDYGRLILEPNTDWSINWNFSADRPYVAFSYLASLLQELAFRLTQFAVFGARFASVLGAMAAATAALFWLLARNVSARAAWLISLIFLLDPLFVQGYRGARVDCWVFALCLSSCGLLRIAQRHLETPKLVNIQSALAGGLAAVALFAWPSAVLLYPLIALEFCALLLSLRATSSQKSAVYTLPIALVFGGLLTTLLLLLPVWQQVFIAFADTTGAANSRSGFSRLLEIASWRSLLDSFKHDPFLPLVALVGLGYRVQRGLAIGMLLAVMLVINTGVYPHRAVYLLPYLIASIGGMYSMQVGLGKSESNLHRFKFLVLILLLVWSSSLSLIFRPALALNQQSIRNPKLIEAVARSSIGAGEYRVFFVNSYEFYHAGRKLGWHIYSSAFLDANDLQSADGPFRDFLNRLDYVISREQFEDPALNAALERANFKPKFTMLGNNKLDSEGLPIAQLYGPYRLYGK